MERKWKTIQESVIVNVMVAWIRIVVVNVRLVKFKYILEVKPIGLDGGLGGMIEKTGSNMIPRLLALVTESIKKAKTEGEG